MHPNPHSMPVANLEKPAADHLTACLEDFHMESVRETP